MFQGTIIIRSRLINWLYPQVDTSKGLLPGFPRGEPLSLPQPLSSPQGIPLSVMRDGGPPSPRPLKWFHYQNGTRQDFHTEYLAEEQFIFRPPPLVVNGTQQPSRQGSLVRVWINFNKKRRWASAPKNQGRPMPGGRGSPIGTI